MEGTAAVVTACVIHGRLIEILIITGQVAAVLGWQGEVVTPIMSAAISAR